MSHFDFVSSQLIATYKGRDPVSQRILVGYSGNLYYGSLTEGFALASANAYTGSAYVSATAIGQSWYVVDGTKFLKVSSGGTVTGHAATAGSLPANPWYVTHYRNRLVVLTTDNVNWFMSRVGDYGDFDYGQEDASRAVAGNPGGAGSPAGTLSEPIIAFIPFSDDYCLIACGSSLWLLRGDPAFGGSIDNLTTAVGLVGPHAWCRDESGTIFLLGRHDVYAVTAGSGITNLTKGRITAFLRNQDFSTVEPWMEWDAANKRLWVFLAPSSVGTDTPTHLAWESVPDSLSLHQFSNTNSGPTATCAVLGALPGERKLLLGGYDGYLRFFDNNFTTDDGTAISSRVVFPAVEGGDDRQVIVTRTALTLTTVPYGHLVGEWQRGQNPQAALSASGSEFMDTTLTGRISDRTRVRGGACMMVLSNSELGATWGYQGGQVEVESGGPNRT